MPSDALPVTDQFALPHALLFPLGVALILVGVYLRLKFAYLAMHAEERAKDGWLSEDQARRRIAVMRYSGPLMILLGMSAFAVVFWN